VVIYFAFRHWDFAFIANDMATRLTLILATLSTIGLIVLGATSVDAAIRYMGAKNWQRLHTTNYVISGLAILHVVLARGTYTEQYMLTGIFFWLRPAMARRRCQGNGDARSDVVPCRGVARADLLGRRGFGVFDTLGATPDLAVLDGHPPAWQVRVGTCDCPRAAAGSPARQSGTPSDRLSPPGVPGP
jgi:hypothetical protein